MEFLFQDYVGAQYYYRKTEDQYKQVIYYHRKKIPEMHPGLLK